MINVKFLCSVDFSDLSKVIGEAEYVISRDHLSGKLLLTRLNRGQNLNRNMAKQPPPPGYYSVWKRKMLLLDIGLSVHYLHFQPVFQTLLMDFDEIKRNHVFTFPFKLFFIFQGWGQIWSKVGWKRAPSLTFFSRLERYNINRMQRSYSKAFRKKCCFSFNSEVKLLTCFGRLF